ncbi:hypothetical protein ACN38_g7440 [Penicillium nordicum]|uniref:Uncharacterized protein n=1 Tax=Penicillium nordicum TaxID=229535 RepID=A0A0M9WEF2_9EURO|nr:hypothetical protein ACN38_g7440 [Penicillium nordicum]
MVGSKTPQSLVGMSHTGRYSKALCIDAVILAAHTSRDGKTRICWEKGSIAIDKTTRNAPAIANPDLILFRRQFFRVYLNELQPVLSMEKQYRTRLATAVSTWVQ